jgi:ribose-phosphate pyrophosphokinase
MLLHAVEAAKLADALFVTAVLPYYPGARQDKRKGRTREGISAGLFARMLTAAGAHRVLSVEIHNAAIAGMFDASRTTLETVYLHKYMAEWIRGRGDQSQVVVAPDVGGLERARRYAEQLSLGLAAISKERDYSQPNTVARSTLIGEVEGRNVLVVDDIIDTAGSVVAAILELKSHGAENITVACTHPLLSGPAKARLDGIAERAQKEGWQFELLGTSIVPHAEAPSWYHSFSIEPLLARVITTINSRGSVTGL